MKICKKIKNNLYKYLDNELDFKFAKLVENHLQTCGDCMAEMDFVKSLRETLADDKKAELPFGFDESLHLKIVEYKNSGDDILDSNEIGLPRSSNPLFKKFALAGVPVVALAGIIFVLFFSRNFVNFKAYDNESAIDSTEGLSSKQAKVDGSYSTSITDTVEPNPKRFAGGESTTEDTASAESKNETYGNLKEAEQNKDSISIFNAQPEVGADMFAKEMIMPYSIEVGGLSEDEYDNFREIIENISIDDENITVNTVDGEENTVYNINIYQDTGELSINTLKESIADLFKNENNGKIILNGVLNSTETSQENIKAVTEYMEGDSEKNLIIILNR